MEEFLGALDWAGRPWTESHKGAGLYAALHLAGECTPEWEARYFAWLAREGDPETGLWRRGAVPRGEAALGLLFPHLAGTFHYLFNFEHAGKAPPHPAALAVTCERIYARRVYPLARFVSFAEVDWVYCLHRAARHCDRVDAVRPMLRAFATEYLAFLDGLDPDADPGLDDLHALFGATSALAELQNAMPERSRANGRSASCWTAARSSDPRGRQRPARRSPRTTYRRRESAKALGVARGRYRLS